MVLMWGLELTLFAVVMFAWTPASTWAAVNVPDACGCGVVEAASAAVRIASGAARARAAAAATASRVRGDDIAGGTPPTLTQNVSQPAAALTPGQPPSSGSY